MPVHEGLSTEVRTLQVSVDCPWPPVSGGDIRNAFIARSVASLGPVHTFCLGAVNQHAALDVGTVEQLPGFQGKNPWHQRNKEVPTSIIIGQSDLDFLMAEIARFRPHVAILEGVYVEGALPAFRQAGLPAIIDMHNIESDLFRAIRRQLPWRRRIKDMFLGGRQWRQLIELDRMTSLAANETWVVSSLDQQRLGQIGGSAAMLVANPVPDERMFELPIEEARYTAPNVLFIGHLGYAPNVNAIGELAAKIWPLIKSGLPEAKLTLMGRSPARNVSSLEGRADISVFADPVDLIPPALRHGYSLMPIRSGGGTRLKALEAMAAGLVVIATAKAVEGLGLLADEHYLRAETPHEFARHLFTACQRPRETALLAARARAYVQHNFGSETLGSLIRARVQTLAGRRHGTQDQNES